MKNTTEIIHGDGINYGFRTSEGRSRSEMLRSFTADLRGVLGLVANELSGRGVDKLRARSEHKPDHPLSLGEVLSSEANGKRKLAKLLSSLQEMGATWAANALERLQHDRKLRETLGLIGLTGAGLLAAGSLDSQPIQVPNQQWPPNKLA